MTKDMASTLETTPDNSKEEIELYEALLRLEKNKDFQKVILEGYLKNKALASVSMLGVDTVVKRGERSLVIEDLVAISNFNQYLLLVKAFGESALWNRANPLGKE